MEPQKGVFYANTHFQPLAEHSLSVGYLAQALFNKVVGNDDFQNLSNVAFLAGVLHDLGKLDPKFQDWVKKGRRKNPDDDGHHIDVKFTFENHPRHNEISLLLFNFFEKQSTGLNNRQKEILQHVVYWHHAKPYRKDDDFKGVAKVYEYLTKNSTSEQFQQLTQQACETLKAINAIAKQHLQNSLIEKFIAWEGKSFQDELEDFLYSHKGKEFPEFKQYSNNDDLAQLRAKIEQNAHHNLLRACVISADRLVSQKSAQELLDRIEQKRLDELLENQEVNNLKQHLEGVTHKFPDSDRTRKQNDVAKELSELRDIAVLAGPAGCGKTKIALEWARIKNAKKIIWVCPRVQVCQGVFEELITDYLPDARVEIFTGEFKYTNSWDTATPENEYFSGDVIVTTIDQILGSIVTHKNVCSLISFMDASVVFDEYHEYIGTEIFNVLFAELLANKNMRKKYKIDTLLVSATPHYFYLENVLNINKNDVVEMESFNQGSYQIEFVDYNDSTIEGNPFYQPYKDQTFIISNTASTAQLGFIYQKDNENSILFHSKFKRSDKKKIFNAIYESFKKNGSMDFDVLRSGPIVQASLNITAKHMITEMTSPENMLQRLGRLDRFGERTTTKILKVAITEDIKIGKQSGKSSRFLASLNSLQTAKSWYEFLIQNLGGDEFKLSTIYRLYKEFYAQQADSSSAVSQDSNKALKSSIDLLNKKVTEPTHVAKRGAQSTKTKISKNSLRGDSRFVQLAKLNLNAFDKPIFENEYAYHQPEDDESEYDNLTESLNIIRNSGLITFIAQKHGRVDLEHPVKGIPDKKQQTRCRVLEAYARDPDYPLYLSYTQTDLEKVGGAGERFEHAIYYAVCDKQAIGSISLDKLSGLTTKRG